MIYIEKKFILLILLSIFLLIIVFFGPTIIKNRYQFTQNPIGYRVLANWHSLRKITNIIHVPYWFKKTDLDVYNITIPLDNYSKMSDFLPVSDDGISFSSMREDDKMYVKANFVDMSNGYSDEIKIRYRGTIENNWNAEKRAYRIKFPKDNLFEGRRAINLFLPYDRAYYGEMLNSYRAEKLGLVSANFKFVRVFVNGKNKGVYLASEPWSKELLAREGIIDTDEVYAKADLVSGLLFQSEDNFGSVWKKYINEDESMERVVALEKIIKLDDDDFLRLIPTVLDIEKVLKWQLISLLASSNHQSDNGNTVLLFKKETGKFELVPWDVNMYSAEDYKMFKSNSLLERILSFDVYFKQYQEIVKSYINDSSNLEDDLNYYDKLYKETKGEFYNDQAKLHNDIMYDNRIAGSRKKIIDNYNNAKKILEYEKSPFTYKGPILFDAENLGLSDEFEKIKEIVKSKDEFLLENKQFTRLGENIIVLKTGKYSITKNIIIPSNLKLVIESGVEIKMSSGASLISYSPVEALGIEENPIVIKAADVTKDPWGVFAVINTGKDKSVFEYLNVSGGSTEQLNGVFFTSQFSLHDVIAKISHSNFSNSKSDDAFHAILGSVIISDSSFDDNYADGIDLDFVTSSLISSSSFANTEVSDSNGDAIDVSSVDDMKIIGVNVSGYGDKCISVGEASSLYLENALLHNCSIGVAVKDDSFLDLKSAKLFDNDTAISLYRKKPGFVNGGRIRIEGVDINNNSKEYYIDEWSELIND